MTKDELMLLTIQQLTENFFTSPECFELEDPDYSPNHRSFSNSTIVFQSKPDPNCNQRAVTLTYNDTINTITCHIFFRAIVGANTTNIKPDATVVTKVSWKMFNRSYKMFKRLRSLLLSRKRDEESSSFLQKLHSVFPGTFDDYIFGDSK